jgi:hypothetical protein
MFQVSLSKGGRKTLDGRPLPRISDLVMSHVPGSASEKLAWLQAQIVAGKLDCDDPEEIAQAEAMLAMLARLAELKRQKRKQHLEELLDRALEGTFPASDPVSVGRFTSTEAPSRPIDREVGVSIGSQRKGRRKTA